MKVFSKLGTDEMTKLGLDPDEIRLKLDQIMEWNELPTENQQQIRDIWRLTNQINDVYVYYDNKRT